MSASNPSNQQSQLLKEYVHWYVSQYFHDLDNPIRDVVDRLLGEINRSSVSSNVRNVMMDEILAISANLVNHPDPQIRTDTMVLVIQLSSVPYSIGGGVDVPIPYLGMIDFLVEQLENDQQLLEVKILSARGLARVCRDGAPSSIQKSKIATAFVGQLQAIPPGKEDDRWWYRYRLIEGLGYVDRLDDVGGKPIVIDSLVHVLSDVNEVWINRSQAALSISRLPYTGAVNVQLIAYEIGRLLSQMTNAYNTSPKASIWKHTYSRVYLSFRPANAKEAAKRWGLLEQVKRPGVTQNENAVLELWDASFPMFQAVLTGSAGAIPDSDVNGLKTWMTDNTPSNRSVVPGAQPLPAPGQGAAPAQTTNPPAGGGTSSSPPLGGGASGTNDNAATNTPPTGG